MSFPCSSPSWKWQVFSASPVPVPTSWCARTISPNSRSFRGEPSSPVTGSLNGWTSRRDSIEADANATISEHRTTMRGGFSPPYFFSRIKPCLIHDVLHRTATPSESKNARCFKDFYEILRNGVTQEKAVCLCQFAKNSVFDTSKHEVWQGNMHCLSLAHQQKINHRKELPL